MQKQGTRFIADWVDALGHRHRKAFTEERPARSFEQRMIATSKLAVELGQRIGRGITKRGPARAKEIRAVVEQCSKIAMMAALKKPLTPAVLNQVSEMKVMRSSDVLALTQLCRFLAEERECTQQPG